MRKAALLLVILALGFGIGWSLSAKGEDPSGSSPPSGEAISKHTQDKEMPSVDSLLKIQLKAAMDENKRLKKELEALEAKQKTDATRSAEKKEDQPKEIDPSIPYEEQYQKMLQKEYEIAKKLDDLLTSEHYDTEWASETEGKIKSTLGNVSELTKVPLESYDLIDSACRSSMCRVVLAFDNEDNRDRVMNVLTMKEPFNTTGWIHSEGLEDCEVELYFSKKGETLPDLDKI